MMHKTKIVLLDELKAIQKRNNLEVEKIATITRRKNTMTIKRWLSGKKPTSIKAVRYLRAWENRLRKKSHQERIKRAKLPESTKILSDIAAISTRHLAEAHVDWLLKTIRPLLISQFIHGYKHGRQEGSDE